MQDLDPSDIQVLVTRLFEASKNLDDDAFALFVAALCRLSSEMVGAQAANRGLELEGNESQPALLSPAGSTSNENLHRRRASGIQIARTPQVR